MLFVALLLTLVQEPQQTETKQELFQVECLAIQLQRWLSENSRRSPTDGLHSARPLSLAHLETQGQQELVRATFFGPKAYKDAQAFLHLLVAVPVLSLCQQQFHILTIQTTQSPWAGVGTWADFTKPTSDRMITLSFVTPITLHDPAKEISSGEDFPEALTLFSQLLKQWYALKGPPLPEHLLPFLQRHGCIVADYQLQTQCVSLGEEVQLGFTGWIRYECREEHSACIALHSLAHFASIVGTGFYLDQGMGATSIIKT